MSNIVAIVGRPNVGKSTLFNRLTESRDAIVKEVSGVTRDRLYGKGEWNGYQFSVIDTGGYATTKEDIFEGEIRKQVQIAIEEATVIVFMVDVMTGIVEMDQTVAQLLRKSKKPVLIAANKVDNTDRVGLSSEFYTLAWARSLTSVPQTAVELAKSSMSSLNTSIKKMSLSEKKTTFHASPL